MAEGSHLSTRQSPEGRMILTAEFLEKRLAAHMAMYGEPPTNPQPYLPPCDKCRRRYASGYQSGYSAGRRAWELHRAVLKGKPD
jgi:hypothetical protein